MLHKELEAGFRYVVFCTNVTYKDQSWKSGQLTQSEWTLVLTWKYFFSNTLIFPDLANYNVDPAELEGMTLQREMVETWRGLDSVAKAVAVPTVEDAINFIRTVDGGRSEIDVLVTGSFHLVGGVLTFLEGEDAPLASISPNPTSNPV